MRNCKRNTGILNSISPPNFAHLSLHQANFVEVWLVVEGAGRDVPDSEEGFRLGERMMRVGRC
jgi:hypothetical protein